MEKRFTPKSHESGTGTEQPTLLSPSRAHQLVLSKVIKQTQLYVTLRALRILKNWLPKHKPGLTGARDTADTEKLLNTIPFSAPKHVILGTFEDYLHDPIFKHL